MDNVDDKKTSESLFENHKGIVIKQMTHYPLNVREDVEQAGYAALWEAAKGFDAEQGYTFSTYAWRLVQKAMNKTHREIGWPVCLTEYGYRNGHIQTVGQEVLERLPVDERTNRDRNMDIHNALSKLGEEEEKLIRLRFGFDGDPYTFGELGEHFGITSAGVYKRYGKAIGKLGKYFEVKNVFQ